MSKTKIELYVNGELIELDENVRIILRNTYMNASGTIEGATVVSYSFTIKFTDNNVRILRYINKEETVNKFNQRFNAILNVDDTTIIDGQLKIDSIFDDEVSVVVGVKGSKTASDIFGDKTFADFGDWRIPFNDFHTEVAKYNTTPNAPFIFPLVMYGLLPKRASSDGLYTDKDLYDDSVNLNFAAFMPSFNCTQLLQKMFQNQGYTISGDFFSDDRLNSLYMSYKNETTYIPDFNYGEYGIVKYSQKWSNCINMNNGKTSFEPTAFVNTNPKAKDYANRLYTVMNTDLLSTVNGSLDPVTSDLGGNIIEEPYSVNGIDYKARYIHIPKSGYYKVTMQANIRYNTERGQGLYGNVDVNDTTLRYISPVFKDWDSKDPDGEFPTYISTLKDRRSEIKLMRANKDNEFDFGSMDIDRGFYNDAIGQDYKNIKDVTAKFNFPEATKMMFIDPAQDANLVCGISFGTAYDRPSLLFENDSTLSEADKLVNPIVLKSGASGVSGGTLDKQLIAAQSDGYIQMQYNADGTYSKEASDYMKTDLINTDPTMAVSYCDVDLLGGKGAVQCIAWFEEGDRLKVVHTADYNYNQLHTSLESDLRYGATFQEVDFDLVLEPFIKEKSWMDVKLNYTGGTVANETIDWEAKTTFEKGTINLKEFLPQKMKLNDWLTNFCKAANMVVVFDEKNKFKTHSSSRRVYDKNPIDLDQKTDIRKRENTMIKLPSAFDISFTINEDEYGYKQNQTTGAGYFETWNVEGQKLVQKSNFSYCWYKDMRFTAGGNNKVIKLPIISDNKPFEVEDRRDYGDQMQQYLDLAQRFWYKADNMVIPAINGKDLTVSLVSNTLDERNEITYQDRNNTMYSNFFTSLLQRQTAYTKVKCRLTNEEYKRIGYTYIRFNGSIYVCAEINGHDVSMINEATLTLVPITARS